ncbi:hypothetical protein J3F84DRAFT_398930 [Trichoderma pleuroticola]
MASVTQPSPSQPVNRKRITFDRHFRRRGPPARSRTVKVTSQMQPQSPTYGLVMGADSPWEFSYVADTSVIEYLADQYHRIVYPIFYTDIVARRYLSDRSFCTLTMAVCVTASTRLSGELPSRIASARKIKDNSLLSGIFYTACMNALPVLHTDEVELDFMRAEALLGMLYLEYNNIRGCHTHLHRYLAMCAETGFNDESQWSPGLTAIEIEERHRLRGQTQCQVFYPAEVYDDSDIAETDVHLRGDDHVSFICGWNIVTDLYRILEHFVQKGYRREARPLTGQRHQDRYGFQVVNATITLSFLKMVLAQTEDRSVNQLCTVAKGFLDELLTIPTAYIRSTLRFALLAMAYLINSLETAIKSSSGIALKLRDHVKRISMYMTEAVEKSRRNQTLLQERKSPPDSSDTRQDNTFASESDIRLNRIQNAIFNVPIFEGFNSQLSDELSLEWPFFANQGGPFTFPGNDMRQEPS